MKTILGGFILFIAEWLLYANIYGHLVYIGNTDTPYEYWTVFVAGTIAYIFIEFILLKIDELKKYLINYKD